jgi:hypothetical protein
MCQNKNIFWQGVLKIDIRAVVALNVVEEWVTYAFI